MLSRLIPLAEPLTAKFPLTLLLLKAAKGDLRKFGVGSEDAVLVEFHGFVCHVTIISIGWGRSVDHVVHLVCWHTWDGVTPDPLRVWTPLLNRLIHYSIVLTICSLRCFTLTFFPKENDRMAGRFVKVDLYLVERKVAFGWHFVHGISYRRKHRGRQERSRLHHL